MLERFRNGHQLDTARNLRTLYHWGQAYAVPVPIAIGRLEVIVLKIDFAQKGVANAAVRGVTDKIGTSGRKLIGQTNAGQAEKACRPDRSNPIVGNGTWNRPRAVHESIDSNGCRQTVVLSEIAERLSPSRSRGRRWGRRRDPTVSSKVRARGIFSELVQRSVTTSFGGIKSLLPSFDLFGRNVVMPGAINQNVRSNEGNDNDSTKRAKQDIGIVPRMNLRLHVVR